MRITWFLILLISLVITFSQAHPVYSRKNRVSIVQSKKIASDGAHFLIAAGGGHHPIDNTSTRLSPRNAKLSLVLVASLYGVDYSLNKILQEDFHPEVVTALKYTLATLYFLIICKTNVQNWRVVRVGLELGGWCSMYALSLAHSLQSNRASKVAFFAALGVIMPPLYDRIASALAGKRPASNANIINDPKRSGIRASILSVAESPFVAPALALCGVLLMNSEEAAPTTITGLDSVRTTGSISMDALENRWCADLLSPAGIYSILSALPWRDLRLLVSPACSSLCYWRSEQLATQEHYDPLGAATVMLGTVAVLTSVYCVVKFGLSPAALRSFISPELLRGSIQHTLAYFRGRGAVVVALLGASSLLATAWTTLTEQRALQVVSAAEAYVVLSLEPLFAAAFATALLGEPFTTRTAGAALLILAACLWRPALSLVRPVTKADSGAV